MESKKILITGGAGFIGHHLARRLLSLDAKVIVYDALLNHAASDDNSGKDVLAQRLKLLRQGAKVLEGDVRDSDSLEKALHDHSPDVVIHLAAIPIARTANNFPQEAVQININGTVNLLEAIRSVGGVKRFVFVSSSFVYGHFSKNNASEDHPLNPIDIYGATKLSGEILTKAYWARFGVEYSIVRPSAVYGSGDANRRVVQKMVENAMKGLPLTMDNGGVSCLDFTYIDDIVSGIVLAAFHENAKNETFNMTRGEGRSIRELVDILRESFHDLTVTERGQDEKRPERGGLDIAKASSLLGYAPQYSLEAGIRKYIDSFSKSAESKASI